MIGILIRRGNLETDISARTPCEDEGRDRGGGGRGALPPKEQERFTAKHQKLGGKMERILSHSPQKEESLLTPCSQTSRLQECDTPFYCVTTQFVVLH